MGRARGTFLLCCFCSFLLGHPLTARPAPADESEETTTESDAKSVPYEEDADEQGLYEDARPAKPAADSTTTASEPEDTDDTPQSPAPTTGPVQTKRPFHLEAQFVLDYYFFGNRNHFTVKYAFKLDDTIAGRPAVEGEQSPAPRSLTLRGNADVKTEIDGVLAKGTGTECLLEVSVPKVPYNVLYHEASPDQARVTLKKIGPVAEDWAANCQFSDMPNKPLRTTGAPEHWLNIALEQLTPLLQEHDMPLSDVFESEWTFSIPTQRREDAQIGALEIRGEGKLRIDPPKVKEE